MAGLCFLTGDGIGELLYHSSGAGMYIRIFAPLIVILYLDTITDGMLKGLGQQLHTVRYNTMTSILDVTLIFFLLPRYGIGGFLFAFTVTHGINFFFSLRRLLLVTEYFPTFRATIRCTAACGMALGICRLAHFGIHTDLFGVLLSGLVYLSIYALLLFIFGGVLPADLQWLRQLIRQKP